MTKEAPKMSKICGNEELLAAYIDGRLAESDRRIFERHLSGCPSCLGELIAVKSDLDNLSTGAESDLWVPLHQGEAKKRSIIADVIHGPSKIARLFRAGGDRSAAMAVSTAILLVLLFAIIISSPAWDPDLHRARSGLNAILSDSPIGDLRLSNGRPSPPVTVRTIRGTEPLQTDLADEVEKSLKRSINKYPGRWQTLEMLGHLYLSQGNPSRAKVYYSMILEIEPGNKLALNDMAVASYRSGDIAGSLEYLNRGAHSDGRLPEIYYNLAVLHLYLGDRESAKSFAAIFASQDPLSPWTETILPLLR